MGRGYRLLLLVIGTAVVLGLGAWVFRRHLGLQGASSGDYAVENQKSMSISLCYEMALKTARRDAVLLHMVGGSLEAPRVVPGDSVTDVEFVPSPRRARVHLKIRLTGPAMSGELDAVVIECGAKYTIEMATFKGDDGKTTVALPHLVWYVDPEKHCWVPVE